MLLHILGISGTKDAWSNTLFIPPPLCPLSASHKKEKKKGKKKSTEKL